MVTTVWLFKPRSHGRKRKATRARNGAPLPGRRPSFHMPHRSASSALCPCGHAACGTNSRDGTMWAVAVRPRAPDVALLPSSRLLGRSMPELLCHPIPFVMRRVVYDLRRPRAGGCERTKRENSAYTFERWDGVVGCRSELRGGSRELVVRGVAGGMGGGSWLKNSAILGVKHKTHFFHHARCTSGLHDFEVVG